MNTIMGDWLDAVSTLFSFTRHSDADEELVLAFKHKVVRIVSLLNSVMMGELEGVESKAAEAQSFELIDVAGLQRGALEALSASDCQSEVLFQWLQNEVVDSIKNGVLAIPAPLLTRSFQDIGSVMIRFHMMMKFPSVPFPFPYLAAAELLLVVHWLCTPFAMLSWTHSYVWLATFTFMLVFMLWSLHFLSSELENPFESDVNDLDMRTMQKQLNQSLVTLLTDDTPTVALSCNATQAAERVKLQFDGEATLLRGFSESYRSWQLKYNHHSHRKGKRAFTVDSWVHIHVRDTDTGSDKGQRGHGAPASSNVSSTDERPVGPCCAEAVIDLDGATDTGESEQRERSLSERPARDSFIPAPVDHPQVLDSSFLGFVGVPDFDEPPSRRSLRRIPMPESKGDGLDDVMVRVHKGNSEEFGI